jgi:hypothetical protein
VRRTPFLVLLVSLAFLVRFAAVCALRDLDRPPEGAPSNDDVQFNALATQMARGNGYRDGPGQPLTSFRAPGFPLLLAGLYRITGESPRAAYLAFCVLGAAACLLTYVLGRTLLPEGSARLAALLAVFYLPDIWFSTVFLSEVVFVPFLALGLWGLVRYLRGGGLAWLALAGAALGYATLTRPFALLLLPLCGVLLLWAPGTWGRRWVGCAVYGLLFVGVIAPWTFRNYRVHGKPVLVATNGGSTFYGGNNDIVVTQVRHFGHWISTTELPHRDRIEATPDEAAHDRMEWELGWRWLRQNPGRIPLLCVLKLVRLWWLPDFDPGHRLLRALTFLPYLVLFLAGFVLVFRRREYRALPWWPLHMTVLATVVTALIFWGSPRFRDADTPVLMLYAVLPLQWLWPGLDRPPSKEAGQVTPAS